MSRSARLVVAASFSLAATAWSCPPAGASPDFPWPDWSALRARYPDAGAVRLLHETTTRIADLGADDLGKRVSVRIVIAVIDPVRARDWLEWTIPDTEGHRITNLVARTWLSPSRHEDVRKNQIFTVSSFPDYVLYGDIKGKRFAFPAVSRETVVDLRYEYTSVWNFSVEHVFARDIPTLLSRAVLVVPRDFLIEGFGQSVRAYRLPANPERRLVPTPEGEVREFVWELHDVAAIPFETGMPPLTEIAPFVRLAFQPPRWSNEGWESLGRNYYVTYFEPRRRSTAKTRALAAKLTAGCTTTEEKVRAIYRFAQSEIRYVAVELGIGGIQPHDAGETLRMSYGDCKDKVCLMLSLLQDAGVEARPALVRTQRDGEVDSLLLDLGQFNHMIARVRAGNRDWWLDPTAQFCSADYLPSDDQGTLAFVVGPEGGALVETPIFPAKASSIVCGLDGRLAPDGTLSGTLRLEASGDLALSYRAAFAAHRGEQRRLLASELLGQHLPGARLTKYEVARFDSLDRPLSLALEFEWPRCGTRTGDAIVLPGDFLRASIDDKVFEPEKRIHPLLYDCLEKWEDRVRIAPPPGYRVELPAWASLPGEFHSLYEDTREEGGAVLMNRALERKTLVIRPAEFPRARAEVGQIQAALAEPFRFSQAP